MTTVVAKTRRPVRPADTRYSEAIDELRKALGDGEAFDAAQTWAIEQCRKSEEHDWLARNRFKEQFEEKWKSASTAARKLAEHLEAGGLFGAQRISQAEKQIGMKLRFDSGEPNDATANDTPGRVENERHRIIEAAFPKLLRALSRQPVPRQNRGLTIRGQHIHGPRYFCGPLMITARKRMRGPTKTEALALALSHGFRKINECVEDEYPIEVARFDRIRMEGGKPCYHAAALFANITFSHDAPTSEEAIVSYLKRNRSGLMFWGFDEGDR
jgi:hypothetical protein